MFGRSMINDFLNGNDPFANDPFFQQPFGSVFSNDPFFAGSRARQQQRGQALDPHSYQDRQGPVIQEVDGDEDGYHTSSSRPVVEEPDEAPSRNRGGYADSGYGRSSRDHQSDHARQRQRPRHQQQPRSGGMDLMGGLGGMDMMGGGMGMNMGGGGGSSMFMSFSSTSTSANGGPPVTYSKTTTARVGPGGVMESQSTTRDGRLGTETIDIARGLGDRGRAIRRTRDHRGEETSVSYLHNLREQEAGRFDAEWGQAASRAGLTGRGQGRHGGYLGY